MFYILQGGVKTYVRCGKKRNKGFIANALLNLAVKEVWKSANICQSYAWE